MSNFQDTAKKLVEDILTEKNTVRLTDFAKVFHVQRAWVDKWCAHLEIIPHKEGRHNVITVEEAHDIILRITQLSEFYRRGEWDAGREVDYCNSPATQRLCHGPVLTFTCVCGHKFYRECEARDAENYPVASSRQSVPQGEVCPKCGAKFAWKVDYEITLVHLPREERGKRHPMPGDAIQLTYSDDSVLRPGCVGVVHGTVNHKKDEYDVIFYPHGGKVFKDDRKCYGSGGPVHRIPVSAMVDTGHDIEVKFWKWKNGHARYGESVDYPEAVALFQAEHRWRNK